MTDTTDTSMHPRERRLREDVAHAAGFLLSIQANATRCNDRGRDCMIVPVDQLRYLGAVLAGSVPNVEFSDRSGAADREAT